MMRKREFHIGYKLFAASLIFTLLGISNMIQLFVSFNKTAILISSVLTIAASVLLFLIARNITSSLGKICSRLSVMSKGNFKTAYKLDKRDELRVIGEQLNLFAENLGNSASDDQQLVNEISTMISNLKYSASETSNSIEEVTRTIYDIAQGSSEQLENMRNTAELIALVTEAIGEVTKNSESMSEYSKESTDLIESSHTIVEQLKVYTGNAIDNSSHVAGIINEMSSKSERIGDIVGLITGIASQTKMLALNAAIEAARAGEEGRGFAVVAEKIRDLAEQVASSTKQISVIVNDAINDTKSADVKMSETYSIIEKQKNSIFEIIEAFGEIRSTMTHIAEEVSNSKVTLFEVNAAVEEMNMQAIDVTRITESNAAATQEVSAASEEQLSVVESIFESIDKISEITERLRIKTEESVS